jgi:glycosyltransferase involved in cell wall biosynthesis
MIRTAFVATYPPQLCGIATFTSDLAAATGSHAIVALRPPESVGDYPPEVGHHIRRDVPGDYEQAAAWLDASGSDVVSIQHEYGIWGGTDGAHVLDLVRTLRTPSVATLHTVLRHPTPSQHHILTELVEAVEATVVMSSSAARLLRRSYGIDPARVEIVPHGVPDLPLVAPDRIKPRLGLEGRTLILSFGLLGPGKGYESVIAAMPALVQKVPDALYVIVGATHPDLLRHEGESYRRRLESLAASLGVVDHVRFEGRFMEVAELTTWLLAADIFVTPYPNLEQIVSGTLSYAMGAGKAIVSTPYTYARERLAQGRGLLVEPGSTSSLTQALVELAQDEELRRELGRRAYAYSRGMRWEVVADAYRAVFERVAPAAAHVEPSVDSAALLVAAGA